jgi:GTP-binding protein EngB required for normal cell division
MRVVATAGHVDHGKSSLVLALTGTDPDRFEEEKRRGLTIDLGFAHAVLPSGEGVSFIDVPGHVRFLRNMLAGVGGIDACMFVVAATEGWKPQSEEHLRILELLGIRHGIIALTKVDLVDDELRDMSRERSLKGRRSSQLRHRQGSELTTFAAPLTSLLPVLPLRKIGNGRGCGSTGYSLPRAAAPSSPARLSVGDSRRAIKSLSALDRFRRGYERSRVSVRVSSRSARAIVWRSIWPASSMVM